LIQQKENDCSTVFFSTKRKNKHDPFVLARLVRFGVQINILVVGRQD
jgi:hypothetical protein